MRVLKRLRAKLRRRDRRSLPAPDRSIAPNRKFYFAKWTPDTAAALRQR